MRCIETTGRAQPERLLACLACLGLAASVVVLGGCGQRGSPAPMAPPLPSTQTAPIPPTPPTPSRATAAPSTSAPASPSRNAPVPPAAPRIAAPVLGPPVAARTWQEFQLNAARRLVAANPERSYLGVPPDPLLAIPVLEVDLNADGSVRAVRVLRRPTQAPDTVQVAVDAVHRAAPFGDMTRLPRPWRFAEVFLFDDQRRFKPRTLEP